MLQDSMDALCDLINTTFPDVETIYTNTTPDKLDRPSFFVMLATDSVDHLNKSMYQVRLTWQIVYFAPLGKGHIPDPYSQLAASNVLKSALMDSMILTGSSGTVYHILDVKGGPRDNEVYITVRIEAEKTRPEPEYDLIADIDHNFNEEG